MTDIRSLPDVDDALLGRLIAGYTSTEVYRVAREETPDSITFELQLVALEQPFVKQYPPLDAAEIQRYRNIAVAGHAFGAFEDGQCIGIALCEPQYWNSSLIVWEFHIAPTFHRKGIGHALIVAVEAHTRAEGMRCVVCETQTTNMPAIRFYRAMGFAIDSIDISLYSNDDIERGEVAIFLKKRISHPPVDETSIPHRDE